MLETFIQNRAAMMYVCQEYPEEIDRALDTKINISIYRNAKYAFDLIFFKNFDLTNRLRFLCYMESEDLNNDLNIIHYFRIQNMSIRVMPSPCGASNVNSRVQNLHVLRPRWASSDRDLASLWSR